MYTLNEETIAPEHTMEQVVEQKSYLILLPLVGLVEYKDSEGSRAIIEAGQLYIKLVEAKTHISIYNPLETELVNFLQWRMTTEDCCTGELDTLVDFDIDLDQGNFSTQQAAYNTLFFNRLPFLFNIGKLAGREEIVYKTRAKNSKMFAFVIQGAFELQGRLLHQADGLAIWETDLLEIEALSNNAIIVLLEMPSWL